MENKEKKPWYKKWWLIILIIVGILIALVIIFPPSEETDTDKEKEEPAKPTEEKKETWNEVLYDIVEFDKNNGETKTREFKISSEKWRIRWAKRELAAIQIKVFTSSNKLFGKGFSAGVGKPTKGTLNFTGSGTYYVLLSQSTNPDAGVSEIRVEELNQ